MYYDISIYPESIKGVPKDKINTKKICKLIAENPYHIYLNDFAECIEKQHIWCPATFYNGEKKQNNLKSIQLFALDFDGGITIDEVLARAERYKIPVALYYETMSSVNFSRFRTVFICNQVIENKNAAILIQHCIYTIFPEADSSSKDFSKLYYPGRNVRYKDNIYFSIYDLLLSTMQYLDENNSTNKAREIKKIAEKSGIALRNNAFYIAINSDTDTSVALLPPTQNLECEEAEKTEEIKKVEKINEIDGLKKIEEIRTMTIYNNMVDDRNSSKISYNIFFSNGKPKNLSEKSHIIKVNIKSSECCQLLNEFIEGRRLDHEEWFGLMLNLIHIKGGKELFLNIIEKYSDKYGDISRKAEQMNWAVKSSFNASNCDNYCPYADSCHHGSNMCYTLKNIGKGIYPTNEEIHYTDLKAMRSLISDELHNSLGRYGMNVIKAPTGAGKTYAYLNEIKNSDKQTVVALPNAKLMRAVAEEAHEMGIDYIETPIIDELLINIDKDTANEIRFLYALGDDMNNNFILRNSESILAKEYLKKIDNIRKFKGQLILTTHARLLNLKPDYLSCRNVIVDEDILPQMMQVNSVSKSDIKTLLARLNDSMPIDEKIYTKLYDIMNTSDYRFLNDIIYPERQDIATINSLINKNEWSSAIYHALCSRCFYGSADDDRVYFLYVKPVPECNFTLLSATADETVYSNIFKDRLTNFTDLGNVRNTGKLILHSDKTYSRNCLNEDLSILSEIREKHDNVITFKEYAHYGEVYLGAAQGFNYLQGRDLAVVGTFHRPEYVYKLWHMYVTNSISNDGLAVRRVKRNGFNFPLMTFKDELLQAIQLYMIESESEQAVGRARLISNDCTVHLYSNFPLKQSSLNS